MTNEPRDTLTTLRTTATRILAATPEQHITIDPRGMAEGVLGLLDLSVRRCVEFEDRADRAEAALDRIKALHSRVDSTCACGEQHGPTCFVCAPLDEGWPCDTIRAIEGEDDE